MIGILGYIAIIEQKTESFSVPAKPGTDVDQLPVTGFIFKFSFNTARRICGASGLRSGPGLLRVFSDSDCDRMFC